MYNTNCFKLKIANNLYELVDHSTKPAKINKKQLDHLGLTKTP